MTKKMSGHGESEWLIKREKYRNDYNKLGQILDSLLDFNTILDIGSANGFFIDYYIDKKDIVTGIEKENYIKPYLSLSSQKNTIFDDIIIMNNLNQKYDLVTCIEVAEHIDYKDSDKLVEFIVNHAKDYIYFTAATPYQKGNGHINCQSHFFWLNKFRRYDYYINYNLTEELVSNLQSLDKCKWLYYNSLILVKQG